MAECYRVSVCRLWLSVIGAVIGLIISVTVDCGRVGRTVPSGTSISEWLRDPYLLYTLHVYLDVTQPRDNNNNMLMF